MKIDCSACAFKNSRFRRRAVRVFLTPFLIIIIFPRGRARARAQDNNTRDTPFCDPPSPFSFTFVHARRCVTVFLGKLCLITIIIVMILVQRNKFQSHKGKFDMSTYWYLSNLRLLSKAPHGKLPKTPFINI